MTNQNWKQQYNNVDESLEKIKNIKSVATAFNTNIDAVIKIKPEHILNFISTLKISKSELLNIEHRKINSKKDVVKGIFRCFKDGIAEEWLTDDIEIYKWMDSNIGYDRLQMGGQGGIISNAISICGAQNVIAHCNSLPSKQAEQFLKLDNLKSFDDEANLRPAHEINRSDLPLIHWIIEFDKGDEIIIEGEKFTCPKSNRFIATYDPLNLNLVINRAFKEYFYKEKFEYMLLSGFHALTSENHGENLIDNACEILKQWKNNSPESIIHLEVASTQDVKIRSKIVNSIIPIVDSIGTNERETIDILEVIEENEFAKLCDEDTSVENLFDALIIIKNKTKAKRIQLHMFGLYITIQDKNYPISPIKNKNGMCLAATVAASKAGLGDIHKRENLLWAKSIPVDAFAFSQLEKLSNHLDKKEILETGICEFENFDIIATPTKLVEKPKTLVGMGDTISSISLLGAR